MWFAYIFALASMPTTEYIFPIPSEQWLTFLINSACRSEHAIYWGCIDFDHSEIIPRSRKEIQVSVL